MSASKRQQDMKLNVKWMENAACKDMGPELFLSENKEDKKRALAVCAGCLVIKECLDYAMDNFEKGIWGGTTDVQRRRLRRYSDKSIEVRLGRKLDSLNNPDIEK